MTTPIVFSAADFRSIYPEFAALTDPQLANYFAMSNAYFQNNTRNLAFCNGVPYMTSLAYMVTAHIAWLLAPRDSLGNPSATGQSSPQTVGQITNATEGSVSVTLKDVASGANELASWFTQTKYGFMFWQATAQYRTMRYAAQPSFVAPAIFPFRGPRIY